MRSWDRADQGAIGDRASDRPPGQLALHLEMAQMAPAAAAVPAEIAEIFEPAMLELRADRKLVRRSSAPCKS